MIESPKHGEVTGTRAVQLDKRAAYMEQENNPQAAALARAAAQEQRQTLAAAEDRVAQIRWQQDRTQTEEKNLACMIERHAAQQGAITCEDSHRAAAQEAQDLQVKFPVTRLSAKKPTF